MADPVDPAASHAPPTARNTEHPVWEVYDDYRTALMNLKIQRAHLTRLKRLNLWVEIPLAVTASTTVAGLWFFQEGAGKDVWKYLGVVTAFLAIVKPFLNIPEKIEQRGAMLTDVSGIECELEKLIKRIKQHRKYDEGLFRQYLKVVDMKAEVKKKYSGAKFLKNSQRIKDRSAAEVERQHPETSFYIPEG